MHGYGGSGGRGFCVTFREGIWYLVFDVGLRMEGSEYIFFGAFFRGLFSFWGGEGGEDRRGERMSLEGRTYF